MCHLILLPLSYSNDKINVISIILLCVSYRVSCNPTNNETTMLFITNHTEKIVSKLKANDEILILGMLLEPILYIDLVINATTIPFHLKSTDDRVIFNSMRNSAWLDEVKLIPNPLMVNNSFMITIFIDINQGFNISFNAQKFLHINKRDSLENIKELRVYGNFTLKSAKITHSAKEEDNSMKTLIIGLAVTFILLIITGMIVFYILRRHCVHTNSKNTSRRSHDSPIQSLGSYTSNKTAISNISYTTGNSFLS